MDSTMNRFYNIITLIIALIDLLIIFAIVSCVVFNKVELMIMISVTTNRFLIQWCFLFLIFLVGLIFYRHHTISSKLFGASIFVILINCYLTYLCLFVHSADIFNYDDFIWGSKRFLIHVPKDHYIAILQVISYIVSIIVKDKKNLAGLKTNIIITLIRLGLLALSVVPFVVVYKDAFLRAVPSVLWLFIASCLVYSIISCNIEFGIDYLMKATSKENTCQKIKSRV